MNKKYLEKVLNMLKRVEAASTEEDLDYDWDENPIPGYKYDCCPICGSVRWSPGDELTHSDDCELKRLMNETEKLLKEME